MKRLEPRRQDRAQFKYSLEQQKGKQCLFEGFEKARAVLVNVFILVAELFHVRAASGKVTAMELQEWTGPTNAELAYIMFATNRQITSQRLEKHFQRRDLIPVNFSDEIRNTVVTKLLVGELLPLAPTTFRHVLPA